MDKLFDYRIPEGMAVEIGVRVIVPFGSRNKRRRAMSFLFPKKQRCLRIKSRSFLRFWRWADQLYPCPSGFGGMDEGTLFLHAEPMPAGNYAARHPHKKQLDSQPKIA